MQNYRLDIQYEGTRYNGWQRQGNTENTIQGRLEQLLARLTGQACVELHGSGRTDAGVHAAGQVASVRLDSGLTPEELRDACNQYLPRDIAVLAVSEAPPRFHARLQAKEKHYRYRISTGAVPDVFSQRYQWRLPGALNTDAMRAAADMLIGTHDFLGFSSLKKAKKSTVRTLRAVEIQETEQELILDFFGDGFLYHMVRILTGTLVETGQGLRTPEAACRALESKNRADAGPLAPAQGLMLMHVAY